MGPVNFFKTFWDIMKIAKVKNKNVVFNPDFAVGIVARRRKP
jgi:hypothetical protein